MWRVNIEDFYQHPVHIVCLNTVPQQRDGNPIVTKNVGKTATHLGVSFVLSDLTDDKQNDEWHTEVDKNIELSDVYKCEIDEVDKNDCRCTTW